MTCNSCQTIPLPAHARPGTCTTCSTKTTSTAIALCPTCSKNQSRCNRCGRSISSNPLLQNGCDKDSCACMF